MEGIAGVVYPDVFQISHLILPMLNSLEHRGGLAQDSHTYKNMQIGICGQKLASNEKKTILAALNGTIYNSAELREQLKKHGYHFTTGSHSEILVHAYELWGPLFLDRLNGDFALVILDQLKEKIFLARDRIGIKPLYWFHDQHHFIFASELKAILATGAVPQASAPDALSSYLFFGYIPQDMTAISNVNKLLPGHYLQFNRDHSKSIQPFWSYSSFYENPINTPRNDIVKHLDQLLLTSVKERVPQNENLACFLYGGLGSSATASYLKKVCDKERIWTYTIGYQNENTEDVEAAREVAKDLELRHLDKMITPENLLDDLVKIVWHLDEPLADPNILVTWRLSAMAAEHAQHAYSGMGSDELLAGHHRYAAKSAAANPFKRLLQGSIPLLKQSIAPLIKYIYKPSAYTLVKESRTNPWQFDYLRYNALFDENTLAAASPFLKNGFDPEVFLHKFHNLDRIKSLVSSFIYFDVKTRLADCYVLQYERLTSAHHIDWHPPFLDQHIVEYLAGIPSAENNSEKENILLLREIVKRELPESIINRPKNSKKGFLNKWVESSGLFPLFKLLSKGTLVESGLISEAWISAHNDTPKKCSESFKYLWALLILEIWFRLFINKPIQSMPPEIGVKELLSESI